MEATTAALDLRTATPSEIDSVAEVLDMEAHRLEKAVESALVSLRHGLGQRETTTGRGAYRMTTWPTTADEAIAEMRAKGTEYIGMGRTAAAVVKRYDDAVAALDANRAAMAPLDAEYARRPWSRFYVVAGGHIHRDRHCSTCNRGVYRTRFGWKPDMSGMNELQALTMLAEQQHVLCTVCFPNAPVVPTAPVASKHCAGSGKPATEGTRKRVGMTIYGDCSGCGERTVVNMDGGIRKHLGKQAPAAAAETPAPAPAPAPAPVVEPAPAVETPAAPVAVDQDQPAAAADQDETPADEETATCRYDGAPIFRNAYTIARDRRRENGGEGWRGDRFDETGRCTAGEHAGPGTPVQHMPVDDGQGDGEAACRRCGCTENRACPGGCAWATDAAVRDAGGEPMDGDVCTACLPATPHAVRIQLADIGQITRELTDQQVDQLCTRLQQADPAAPAGPRPAYTAATPFLAARLVVRAGECQHQGDQPECPAHPGYATADAALASLARDLEAQRRRDEAADDDAADRFLGPARADGPELAEALAIADASGTVRITSPASLLALVQDYGAAAGRAAAYRLGRVVEAVWCEKHDGAHFEGADCLHPHFTDERTRAQLNAADAGEDSALLARIAATLGLGDLGAGAAAVPRPR
jgi:hypothetical protein